jgi:hypothetical protein
MHYIAGPAGVATSLIVVTDSKIKATAGVDQALIVCTGIVRSHLKIPDDPASLPGADQLHRDGHQTPAILRVQAMIERTKCQPLFIQLEYGDYHQGMSVKDTLIKIMITLNHTRLRQATPRRDEKV